MALSTSRALALFVCGAAAVAVARLPLDPAPRNADRPMDQSQVAVLRRQSDSIGIEVWRARAGLRLIERRDALSRDTAIGEAQAQLVVEPAVPPEWRAFAAAQVDSAAPFSENRYPPAMAVVSQSPAVTERRTSSATGVIIDSTAAPFSCLIVHELGRERRSPTGWGPREPRQAPNWSALGVCAFYASYGPPGPMVKEWLMRGAWRLGSENGGRRRGRWFQPVRRDGLPSAYELALAGCTEGSRQACRAWFLAPYRERTGKIEGVEGFYDRWNWSTNPGYFQGLLRDLQADVGAEAFGHFWTSTAPVDSAFAAAVGQDVGNWVWRWFSRQYGPFPPRRPNGGDYAATLFAAGTILIVAITAAGRRQVR